MFGLGKHGPHGAYAIVLDIGSASVGAAIVASDSVTDENPVIFSHRQWAVIKDIDKDQPTRFIEQALLQAFLVLDSKGTIALKQYDTHAKIDTIFVTISAPWAHTITQQAEYEEDDEFEISHELLRSLIHSAKQSSIESDKTKQFLTENNLQVVTNQTLHFTANGYTVHDPAGLTAHRIYLSHTSGIAPVRLIESLREHQRRLFPRTHISYNTFMLAGYTLLQDRHAGVSDACIIDVTSEATEIGVIRNQELIRSSHVMQGTQTLIRILSSKLSVPEGEIRSYLTDSAIQLPAKQQQAVENACTEYATSIAALFTKLGDELSVPRRLYLHSDANFEPFLAKYIGKAYEQATKGEASIFFLSKSLFPQASEHDTAILASSYLFHKNHKITSLVSV